MRSEYKYIVYLSNERNQIDAILSDYDGTLCSTTSVRGWHWSCRHNPTGIRTNIVLNIQTYTCMYNIHGNVASVSFVLEDSCAV